MFVVLEAFHSRYSLTAKKLAGIALIAVTIESMRNVGLHPAFSWMIPMIIYPRMLPKPDMPSMIPDTVASAF